MNTYFDILPADINTLILLKLDTYDLVTFINVLDDESYLNYLFYKYGISSLNSYLYLLPDDVLANILIKLNRVDLRRLYPLFLRREELWRNYLFFKYSVRMGGIYADFGYSRLLKNIKHAYSIQIVMRVNETYTDIPILFDRVIVGLLPIFNSVTDPTSILEPGFKYFRYIILTNQNNWETIYKKNLDDSFSWLSKPLGIPSAMILLNIVPIYIVSSRYDRLYLQNLTTFQTTSVSRGRDIITLSRDEILKYLWMTTVFQSNTSNQNYQCDYYKCDFTSKNLYIQHTGINKMSIINILTTNLIRLGQVFHT